MDFVEICNICTRKAIIKAAIVIVISILASLFWNTVYVTSVHQLLLMLLHCGTFLSSSSWRVVGWASSCSAGSNLHNC